MLGNAGNQRGNLGLVDVDSVDIDVSLDVVDLVDIVDVGYIVDVGDTWRYM